jgi:transcriptional regulator with XRE-family HTH domain
MAFRCISGAYTLLAPFSREDHSISTPFCRENLWLFAPFYREKIVGVFFSLMGFKENLKSELAYRDMLVKELSASTGISRHTIDNYLNVRARIPTADVAVKIARALGVSVEYLVTGEENLPGLASLSPEIRSLIQNVQELDEKDRKMVYEIAQLYKAQRKK